MEEKNTKMGGAFPWKWGEGPVEILPLEGGEPIPGVLSFGSIHTSHPATAIERSRAGQPLREGCGNVQGFLSQSPSTRVACSGAASP